MLHFRKNRYGIFNPKTYLGEVTESQREKKGGTVSQGTITYLSALLTRLAGASRRGRWDGSPARLQGRRGDRTLIPHPVLDDHKD